MKAKILFVEDEDRGVSPYFNELESSGFECILAKDGDEAIDKLASQKFDFISIDIMFNPGQSLGKDIMPIESGLRLLKMIRKGKFKHCDPDVKVVVLTAVSHPIIEAEIRKLGVSAYLKKPINFENVIETFNNLR